MRRLPPSSSGLFMAMLLLATLSAGCIGGDTPPEELVPAGGPTQGETPTTADPLPGPDAGEVATASPLRFPLDDPLDVTHWSNGSFSPEESGLAGGFFTGAFQKQIDLSAHLPAEVPTRVEAVVRIDAANIPIVGPTARADPVSNGTVWYEAEWRQVADGHYVFDGVAKRSEAGTFHIALEAYAPGPGEPPEVSYSISLRAAADPEWVPLGVPVASSVDANDTLIFQTRNGEQAELLIYGPDDRLTERIFFVGESHWTVPPAAAGEVVILPIHGSDDLRILRVMAGPDASEGDLRGLGLHREVGDAHELAPRETTTWTFDVPKRPTRVILNVLGPSGAPWTCAGSLDVQVAAPTAPLLEATADCPSPTNVPFLFAEEHVWSTGLGDPRLTTGTYTATVENTLWYGHRASHVVEWYER